MDNELNVNTDYFQEDQVNTDYFLDDIIKQAKTPINAAESALMTSILKDGGLDPITIENANQIENNLVTLGGDPQYNQVVSGLRNELKAAVMESGPQGLLEAEDTESFLLSLNDTMEATDKLPERPLLVSSASESLSDPNKDYSFLFEDVMAQVAVDQSLADMLTEAEDKVEWTFGDWAEVFTISPATERAFYVDVLEKVGLRDGVADYAFRAPHADTFVDWIRSGKSAEESKERLQLLIDAAIETGDNGVYSSDLLLNVRDQLEFATNDSAITDILEMFVIADIKDITKGLKYLSTKVLGKISARNGTVDSKAIADAEEITKEAVDTIIPRNRYKTISQMKVDPVAAAVGKAIKPLRTGTDSLLDSVYQSNPALVGHLVKSSAPEDISRVLSQVGITPEQLAMRFYPGNGTEGRGMHISWLTGSDNALPVVSPYSNVSQDVLNQIENTARQSLYTPSEVLKGVDREVDELRRASNGVLQPQSTKITQMFDESDEISFQVQFGKALEEGYSTVEEAQFAASRLMGADNSRIVARVKGSGAPAKPLGEIETPKVPHPRFTDEAMAKARREANTFNPKERVVRLTPNQFLKMAAKLDAPSKQKMDGLKGVEKFDDVPFLKVEMTKSGNLKVVGHEGRHRALQLIEDGVKELPVRIRLTDGYWSKMENMPKGINGESGGRIPFPQGTWDEVSSPDLEYLVEANVRHTMVPMDANVFGSNIAGAGFPFLDYAIPYSLRISDEIFNGITAFVGRGDAVAAKMIDIIKPLRKLKGGYKPGSEGEVVNNLLTYGDKMGIVFTRQKANEFLGGRLNDRIWNAYKASRDYFDVMHSVRNKREYLTLHGEGHKSLMADNGKVLEDAKGAIFGKPVSEADLAKVKYVMDESGNPIEVTPDLYKQVEEAGGAIVKVHREATFDGENYYQYVVLNSTSQVKPLTHTPMPKRTGHVDLMYKPEDGTIKKAVGKGNKGGVNTVVKMKRPATLNGEPSLREDTVGIFANPKQANEWIAMRDPDGELGLYSEMTRERAGQLGLSDTSDMMGIPTHALGRGQRLKGPKGEAEILNPIEVMEATVGEIRRTLNHDVIDLLKARFMREYTGMVSEPQKFTFPTSVEELASKFRKENSHRLPEATELFKYIRNQEIGLTGKTNSKYMDQFLRYADSFYTKHNGELSIAGRILESVPGRKTVATLAKANQLTAIAGRVLFQSVASAVQAWTMFARDPVLFGRTITGSIGTISALAVRKLKPEGADDLMRFFGWMSGMDATTFNRYLDQLVESGITATDISDDVISLLMDATKVQAGNLNVMSAAFWKNTPRYGIKGLTLPIDGSIILNKIMGYVHATNMYWRDTGSLDGMFTNAGRDRIRGDMDKLTFTQSRTDQLAYQQNIAKVAFQFMHHVQKMFLNTFVLPALGSAKAVGGMALGNFRLNEKFSNSIYANTKAQALLTFGMTTAMFGAGSILPNNGQGLREKLQEYPEEVRVAIVDGLFNLGFHQWIGETFNISERFAAMDFHTAFMDFVFNEDYSVNLLGPSTMLFDNVAKVKDWIRVHHDNEAMTTEEFFEGLGDRALRLFAGFRDWEKAEIVENLGIYTASNGMNIMETNPDSYWPIMLSLTPTGASEYYGNQDYIRNETDFVNRVVDAYTMDFASWAAQNPMATPDEVQSEIVKMYKWTEAALGQTRVERIEMAKKRLANFLLSPDEPAVARQVKSLFQISSDVHEAIRRLERMQEQYPAIVDDHLIQMLKDEYEVIEGNK